VMFIPRNRMMLPLKLLKPLARFNMMT
jgi:hypothetical protein